jgi:hypothetical protein
MKKFCSVVDENELNEVKTKLMGCINSKEPQNPQVYKENANFPPQYNWIRFRASNEQPLELRKFEFHAFQMKSSLTNFALLASHHPVTFRFVPHSYVIAISLRRL